MKFLPYVFTCAVLACAGGTVGAQPWKTDLRDNARVLKAFRDVVAKPSAATVRVVADGKEVALGAIVASDGWVLTKWDDLKYKEKITCKLKDGKELAARLVGVHSNFDLAMLRIEAEGLPTVEWRPSQVARVGKWVVSVGPKEGPVAIGVVSVATRKYKFGDQPPKYLNPKAGYLGVSLEEAEGGARVAAIAPKSPADKAGIKVKDVIYHAAGRKIIDIESLLNVIQRHKAGETILVKIKRGKKRVELKAKLEKRPRYLLGNPQESMGNVMSHRRGGYPAILQHDTVLKPADCGGPLVDLDGKAVGLNITRAGRTETYAIPSEVILSLMDDFKSGRLAWKEAPTKLEPLLTNAVLLMRNTNRLMPSDAADSSRKSGQHAKIYEIHLAAGVPHRIELESAEFDPYLIVTDASGKKVAEDNNSGKDLTARLVFTPATAGIYRIVATSFGAGETGNFTLTIGKQVEPKREQAKGTKR